MRTDQDEGRGGARPVRCNQNVCMGGGGGGGSGRAYEMRLPDVTTKSWGNKPLEIK